MTNAVANDGADGTQHDAATFEAFFKQADAQRDAFLSRLFGIFSERLVDQWCACAASPYRNLGRPTLRTAGSQAPYYTLDFALRDATTCRVYVAEMKCELQYDQYRYLRLTTPGQLKHHLGSGASSTARTFRWFLECALRPEAFDVRVSGKAIQVDGAILIWGAVSEAGRSSVMEAHHLVDVLSIEQMLADLRAWRPANWLAFIDQYRRWCGELFEFLS